MVEKNCYIAHFRRPVGSADGQSMGINQNFKQEILDFQAWNIYSESPKMIVQNKVGDILRNGNFWVIASKCRARNRIKKISADL